MLTEEQKATKAKATKNSASSMFNNAKTRVNAVYNSKRGYINTGITVVLSAAATLVVEHGAPFVVKAIAGMFGKSQPDAE